MKTSVFALAGLCFAIVAGTDSLASEYPVQTIRVVVPYTPAGPGDLVSRAFAESLSKVSDATVIVENKAGGGGAIGAQAAIQAPADGYTLFFATPAIIGTMLGLKNPGYKMTDFAPVAVLGEQSYVLMVPSALQVSSISDFVNLARKNTAKLNYATLGPGSPSHALADKFQRSAKFEWVDIPYRGAGPATQALLANEVQGYFTTQSTAVSYRESPKLRVLAIAANERGPFLPDVPTFKELGLGEVIQQGWYAMFTRADTPKSVLEKIRELAAAALKRPEMQKHLNNLSLSSYKRSLDDFAKELSAEEQSQKDDNRRLGITPQ